MATNFRAEIGLLTIRRTGVAKRLEYCNSDFKRFNGNDLAINRIKFDELWSSNSGVEDAEKRTPLVDQQFSYVRLAVPLLDIAGSVLSFVGRSVLSFVSPIR